MNTNISREQSAEIITSIGLFHNYHKLENSSFGITNGILEVTLGEQTLFLKCHHIRYKSCSIGKIKVIRLKNFWCKIPNDYTSWSNQLFLNIKYICIDIHFVVTALVVFCVSCTKKRSCKSDTLTRISPFTQSQSWTFGIKLTYNFDWFLKFGLTFSKIAVFLFICLIKSYITK